MADLTIYYDYSIFKIVMRKKSYSVSEFKSKSLGLLEKVARNRESIIVTKRGKPIAEVIPFLEPGNRPEPGKLEGTLISEVDILTPLGAGLWRAADSAE